MTPQERIKADAERMLKDQNEILLLNETYMEGYEEGYIAGATAENERALPVIYLLTEIKSAYGDQFTNHHNEMIEQTLQQCNAGKEVEKEKEPLIPIAVYKQQGCNVSNSHPCPHCGKELNRDRNLCCECGKKVEI